MKQVFEVDWAEGQVTDVLIRSLLIDYFRKLGYPYQSLIVTNITRSRTQTGFGSLNRNGHIPNGFGV